MVHRHSSDDKLLRLLAHRSQVTPRPDRSQSSSTKSIMATHAMWLREFTPLANRWSQHTPPTVNPHPPSPGVVPSPTVQLTPYLTPHLHSILRVLPARRRSGAHKRQAHTSGARRVRRRSSLSFYSSIRSCQKHPGYPVVLGEQA